MINFFSNRTVNYCNELWLEILHLKLSGLMLMQETQKRPEKNRIKAAIQSISN